MKLTQRLQLVRSPQDRYKLAVAERKHLPVVQPNDEEISFYLQRLERLASLFEKADFTWYLEGGNILPLHIGRFLRQHADIDLGIFDENLGKLEQFLSEKGYELFYRNRLFKPLEDTPYDLWEKTGSKEVLTKPIRRLYAVKINEEGTIDEDEKILRELDLHIHRRDGDAAYSLSKQKFQLPYEWFRETIHYRNNGNHSFEIGSLKIFFFFYLAFQRPRHVFDRSIIENQGLLSEQVLYRIRELRC